MIFTCKYKLKIYSKLYSEHIYNLALYFKLSVLSMKYTLIADLKTGEKGSETLQFCHNALISLCAFIHVTLPIKIAM